jgi:hypothetical protein
MELSSHLRYWACGRDRRLLIHFEDKKMNWERMEEAWTQLTRSVNNPWGTGAANESHVALRKHCEPAGTKPDISGFTKGEAEEQLERVEGQLKS